MDPQQESGQEAGEQAFQDGQENVGHAPTRARMAEMFRRGAEMGWEAGEQDQGEQQYGERDARKARQKAEYGGPSGRRRAEDA